MKVLLFISSLGSGGAERQLVTLGLLLKQRGVDVEFLVYHDDPFYECLLTAENIKIYKILSGNYLFRLLRVRRFIRNNNYSAVISFLDAPNFINCFSAVGGKNWKVITAERSAKECMFLSRRGRLFAWFQRFSDHIVCNSENAKNIWLRNFPQYSNKISVIYNTVELPSVSSIYVPKKDNRLHLLIAASYQFLKNPIGFVNALVLMSPEERKLLRVEWYGRKEVVKEDTRAYSEALSIIQKNCLENTIQLYDETKDIYNKMYAADVVGLFSELEGLPNTICEAMVLGKPVIMAKVSDYSVLVDSNGVLCDWDSPESIKKGLLLLASKSNKELTAMGERAQEKSSVLFHPDSNVKKWLNILRD